jgi:hypothetical protein
MNTNYFNLSKRKKRDVLSELLNGNSSEGIIGNKELNAINRVLVDTSQFDSIPKEQKVKTSKKSVKKRKKGTKRKTTHYLTEEVFENLDSAKKKIRTIVPEDLRTRVSKTQIVNRALMLILEEFETKGKNSKLVNYLLKKK